MKRQAEQPALATENDFRSDVQKRRLQRRTSPGRQRFDSSRLFDDEEAVTAVSGAGHIKRAGKPAHHGNKLRRRLRGGAVIQPCEAVSRKYKGGHDYQNIPKPEHESIHYFSHFPT